MKRFRDRGGALHGGIVATIVFVWVAASGRAASPAVEMARQLNQAFIEVSEQVSQSVAVIEVAQREPTIAGLFEGESNPWMERLPDELRRQFERWMRQDEDEESKDPGAPPPLPRRGPQPRPQRPREIPESPELPFNGQGSGVVIREDGYILTNNHVVERAERMRVRFKDGREFDAELRGRDRKSDLAVLKLKGKVTGLKAARFADSDKVRVGEFAIAIGAPFELDYSVTFGHVSAKSRSSVFRSRDSDQDFIQTDASINPGNSGGPLVNIDGEVIGINSMIQGMSTGIGFAIPSNMARQIGTSIIENGRYVRSWLGVSIVALRDSPSYREMVTGLQEGVVVNSIVRDGPAAKSELKLGDIITSVDGKPVSTVQGLRNLIRDKAAGSDVVLEVYRRGKKLSIHVKPEPWPEQEEEEAPVVTRRSAPPNEHGDEALGIRVRELTQDENREYRLKECCAVLVVDAEENGIAQRNGLTAGDVITEVNETSIRKLSDFKSAMSEANLKEGMTLTVVSGRDKIARFVPLKSGRR